MIAITQNMVKNFTSVTELAIEAAKTGNIELLKLFLPFDNVFKLYAFETLSPLRNFTFKLKRLRLQIRLQETVLDCILEAHDLQDALEEIGTALNGDLHLFVNTFEKENKHLSNDVLQNEKTEFKKQLGELQSFFSSEGFNTLDDLISYGINLSGVFKKLKKQEKELKKLVKKYEKELSAYRTKFYEYQHDLAESFAARLKTKGVKFPEGQAEYIANLLKNKAQFSGIYREGAYSLLSIALENGQIGTAYFLIDCGADPQKELEAAFRVRNIPVAHALLSMKNLSLKITPEMIEAKDHNGDTSLNLAVRFALATSDYTLASFLIQNGAYLFETNHDKKNAWQILNQFHPISKEAKAKLSEFLFILISRLFFEKNLEAASFSEYQSKLLETIDKQRNFLALFKTSSPSEKDLKLAKDQLELLQDLMWFFATSHGDHDDNTIFNAINAAAVRFPETFYFKGLGESLKMINLDAIKNPGFAFGVIEKQIKDDPNKLPAYAKAYVNTAFFAEAQATNTHANPLINETAIRVEI